MKDEKNYIGSQQHFEDEINADYDARERRDKEQIDDRVQEDDREPQPKAMKITIDKIYYNGSEFIVNNWPEEPDYEAPDHVKEDLQSALTRAIEEGYVVEDYQNTIVLNIVPGWLTLHETRDFHCTLQTEDGVTISRGSAYKKEGDNEIKRGKRIAILLPKEEIKPAPLGEGKPYGPDEEKQYWKDYGDHLKNPESLGESSEEQIYQHRHLDDVKRIKAAIKSVWGYDYPLSVCARMWDSYSDSYAAGWLFVPESDKDICNSIQFELKHPSPTSEAPEEQEELWREVTKEFENAWPWLSRHINSLSDKYTIHRKRD